ncbi:MAG: carboxymuconolactone decarboxylase family protein [Nostocoides sp.]
MDDPTPIVPPPGLQGLIDHDPGAVDALRELREELERRSGLDERTIELARFAALLALGGPVESIGAHVRRARETGVEPGEFWGVVLAVAPLIGVPRLVATVPAVTAALR